MPEPIESRSAAVLTFTETELLPGDGAPGLEFGSVAYDGATAMVGAPHTDSLERGYAYVYAREGANFTETGKLTGGPQFLSSSFGEEIAVHGDFAVSRTYSSAFVLARSSGSWSVTAELAPPVAVGGLGAVAIHGDTLAVAKRTFGGDDGEIFVYRQSGSAWQLEATLTTAHDATPATFFGSSLVLSGDVLIAGASGSYTGTFPYGDEPPGAAYVFRRSGTAWQPAEKLVPSDSAAHDLFAASMAFDGTTLVVGGPGSGEGEFPIGAIYVFTDAGSGFVENARLSVFPGGDDTNGYRVAVAGERLVNVAYNGGSPGFLSILERGAGGWEPALVVQPQIDTVGLGNTMAFVDDTLVAGGEGHAWAFTLKGEGVCSPDGSFVDLGGGKTEACAPYLCSAGSCRTACTASAECAPGFVCDREQGQGTCIAPGGASEDSGGCALSARGAPTSVLALLALFALSAGMRRRTKR